MSNKGMQKKSRHILKAVGAGYSCEQILASDRTLTYHDIFHAVTEAPTEYWIKASPRPGAKQGAPGVGSIARPTRPGRD